jgi:hypothetical protein
MTPESLILGFLGIEVSELSKIPDSVTQGANRQVFGREWLDILYLWRACKRNETLGLLYPDFSFPSPTKGPIPDPPRQERVGLGQGS